MEIVFKAKKGGLVPAKRAQEVGEELERIREGAGGDLEPQAVVDEARSKKNPLHQYFDWNDSRAAEAHRRQQARQLIGSVVIEVKRSKRAKPVKVRAYASTKSSAGARTYKPATEAAADATLAAQWEADLRSDLARLQAKYESVRALIKIPGVEDLWDQIEYILEADDEEVAA